MDIKIIPVNLGFVKSFLVKGEKTIIVDTGLKGSSKKILKAMQTSGIAPTDVSLILITHAHGDHTGGLKELKDLTGAEVAVHKLEAQYVQAGASAPVSLHSTAMKALSRLFRGQKIDAVQPDILIDGELRLDPWGVDGAVVETPGHTAGSVTLALATGDALTGDMVAGGKKPAWPGVYENLDHSKASIHALAARGTRVFHTAHGGTHRIQDVLKLAEE